MEPFFDAYRAVSHFLATSGHEPTKDASSPSRTEPASTTPPSASSARAAPRVARSIGTKARTTVRLRSLTRTASSSIPVTRCRQRLRHHQRGRRCLALPHHVQLHGCVPRGIQVTQAIQEVKRADVLALTCTDSAREAPSNLLLDGASFHHTGAGRAMETDLDARASKRYDETTAHQSRFSRFASSAPRDARCHHKPDAEPNVDAGMRVTITFVSDVRDNGESTWFDALGRPVRRRETPLAESLGSAASGRRPWRTTAQAPTRLSRRSPPAVRSPGARSSSTTRCVPRIP